MDESKDVLIKQHTIGAVRARTIGTGAFIGFLFFLLWYGMSVFHFTDYPIHNYVKESVQRIWIAPNWIDLIVVSVLMSLFSIFLALIYYVIARKWYSIWAGIIYGFFISLIHMGVLHPLFYGEFLFLQSIDSTVSIISMHMLYGVSIGYSISYDYNESRIYRIQNEAAFDGNKR